MSAKVIELSDYKLQRDLEEMLELWNQGVKLSEMKEYVAGLYEKEDVENEE